MPYTIEKRDDEYCVYKKENDEAVGDTLGCHATREKAAKQIAAIEASEAADKAVTKQAQLYRQTEVSYVTASPTVGKQCANCRWFEYASVDMGSYCRIIENWPEYILITGKCEKWEQRIGAGEFRADDPMPVVVVEEEKALYAMPDPAPKPGKLAAITRQKQQPVSIYKGQDGLRRAIFITSNGYQDREQDYVYTKALQEYVDSCYKSGAYAGDNKLDFEHLEQFDIGDIVAADIIGKSFLAEVALERGDSPLAGLIWDYWERTGRDGSVLWGASHKFYPNETVEDGFTSIRKTRTTVLPITQAANVGTISGVIPMAEEKSHLDAALGITGARQILEEKGVNALVELLTEKGVIAKAKTEDTDTPNANGASEKGNDETFILKMVDAYDAVAKENEMLDESVTDLKTKLEAVTTEKDALKQSIDDVLARLTNMEKQLSETPRSASQASETEMQGKEAEDAARQRQLEMSEQTIGGVRVKIGE